MSYNTRRAAPAGTPQHPQTPILSVASIGQRRQGNFVSGGQLNPQKQGGIQQQQPPQQQQKAPQPANTSVNFRNQNNPGYQTQAVQQQQQQQSPQQPSQPPRPASVKAEAAALPGVNPPNPVMENSDTSTNGENMETDSESSPKKKPFWIKGGKISKKEKMRRRNLRLSKMLQPKNAVMILNELVKNTSYLVEELPFKTEANQFKASVLVEGTEHIGYGRSKIHAKNAAAEVALKHLIKSNKLSEMKKDEEGNEKMDVVEDESQPPLPWQHVASFALFKLFTSWGEDPNRNPTKLQPTANPDSSEGVKQHENKPAKKMPDNPETMNPLMLINQMLPHATFEEIGKTGVPPNITYSYRCTVDGQSFIGTGSNKKAAKKLAAFAACHKVLNVVYPKEMYVPNY